MTPHARDQFSPNDPIRLIVAHGAHEAGASGHIVGRFARTEQTWVVSFDGDSQCVEVRGDEIVASAA
jgi:hypothetical protein